jgi:Sulfatase
MKLKFHRRLVIAAACLSAAVLYGASFAQDVLPRPEEPFHGYIGRTVKDSTKDFPQEVKAPKVAPNILLILTDDVGFGATSPFGGPIPTPTMERLAKEGLRYTQFHTTALCSPTRGTALRAQPPLGGHRRHHGSEHWVPRLQHSHAQEYRHLCRSAQAKWIQHHLVRQEP